MRASGFLEAEHDRAQVGLAQPLRGEPSEHAAFVGPSATSSSAPPLPVTMMTSLAPRACEWRRKPRKAWCASAWVSPCRSSAASIAARPRESSRLSRRSIGASGGVEGFAGRAAGGSAEVGGGAGGRAGLTGFDGVGSVAPRRRATERATSVQSAISSSLRRRKRCGRGGVSFTARPLAAEARRTRPDGEWRRRARLPRRRCRRRGRRAPPPQSPSRCPGRS